MKSVLLVAAMAAGIMGIAAAQASGPTAQKAHGHALTALASHRTHAAGGTASGQGPLVYHGGPVMHTNTTYAIYWVPTGYSMQAGYSTLIDQYFTDVAADSGKTTNVYYTATQYHDGTGHVQYSSKFGGSYTDTTPLPKSGCTNAYTSVCLTAAQLRTELQQAIAANHWTAGPSATFFLFTAKGVGSCDGTQCAFSQYCGYHHVIGSGSTEILYASVPYADTARSKCDGGQHPNWNNADATISVTSHEHNEMITDPRGTAWYDSTHNEDGDKCASIYGTLSGTTAGGKWNQTINGHHYFLQKEYSNARHGCVLTGL